jgi:ATP-binding cassette, subfamily B, bacterial
MSDPRKPLRPGALRDALAFTFRHWKRQPRRGIGIALSMLLATFADITVPVFAGRLVDTLARAAEVGRDAVIRDAAWSVAAMAGLGLLMLVGRHLSWSGIVPFTLRIMSDAAQEAFQRVQRFSTDRHANSFAGSTVRRITRGMWAFDTINDVMLLMLLPSAAVLSGTLVLMGSRWPVLGLTMLAGALLYVVLAVVLATRYVAPASRLSNALDTRLGGMLADAITSNAVVKSFGAESREDERIGLVFRKWKGRTSRNWMRHTWSGTSQNAVLWIVRSAVTGGALWLWWQGRATPGDVTYVLTTYFVVHGYLRDVGQHVHQLQRAVNEMEDLIAIHAQPLDIADLPDAKPIRISGGEVRFEHVDFTYGANPPLYRDLHVTIRAGQRVGLVGPSGSGKTTFVKLVQRLYDPTGGRVLIDGQDVAHATQVSLRRQIAVVQQEPILFHRSLAENIAYARPDATPAEIERAAANANAAEFIARLPKGYGTLVGERGVKLSGGERQRVALARAFLADAPILILDEATSSLDPESEALIQEAMQRLMKGRTAIVIAHRLSTVRWMDRILVFDGGRIVEDDTHEALVAKDQGVYARLHRRSVGGALA